MRMKKTLFVAFAALLLCTSFVTKIASSTGADLFVTNDTDVELDATFTSSIDAITLWGIPPGGVTNSRLVLEDTQHAVDIDLNFASPLPHHAVARIYNKGWDNLVATIDLPAGTSTAGTTLPPPIGNDVIRVSIDRN